MYRAENGSWYCKATLGRDPLTGKRLQVTKRGFPSAADADAARRALLEEAEAGDQPVTAGRSLTADELLDLYLDGIDADRRLAAKTRYDYRLDAAAYSVRYTWMRVADIQRLDTARPSFSTSPNPSHRRSATCHRGAAR